MQRLTSAHLVWRRHRVKNHLCFYPEWGAAPLPGTPGCPTPTQPHPLLKLGKHTWSRLTVTASLPRSPWAR